MSPEAFWQQLAERGWLTTERIKAIRQKVDGHPELASSAQKIAKLLVQNGLLSRQQAEQVLRSTAQPTGNAADSSQPAATDPAPVVAQPTPADDVGMPQINPTARTSSARVAGDANRKSPMTLLFTAVTAVLLVLCIWAGRGWILSPHTSPANDTPGRDSNRGPLSSAPNGDSAGSPHQPADIPASTRYVVSDATDALWTRPRIGAPVHLRFFPADTQSLVHLRLAELWQHPEGQRTLRSLGPGWWDTLQNWLSQMQCQATEIQTLTVCLIPQGQAAPAWCLVAQRPDDQPWTQPKAAAPKSIWIPEDAPSYLIQGTPTVISQLQNQVRDAEGGSGEQMLRRQLRQLLAHTHDSDQLTLVIDPHFLRDEAGAWFAGPQRLLLDGLMDYSGDAAQAVSVGVQLDEVAVVEVRAVSAAERSAGQLQQRLRARLNALPADISDYLSQIQLDPHWQRLALRMPTMFGYVAEQTRIVTEDRQVALSCVLPVEAIHNLVLASELALASPEGTLGAATTPATSTTPTSLAALLAQPTSVRFAQKSLEFAIRDVVAQIRDDYPQLPFTFAVQIVGADLQIEGITRNQQIRNFQAEQLPLKDVLTQLVRQANPTPNLPSAAVPEQKLVWVVAKDRVLITTRGAAAEKQWELPAAFHLP